AFIAGYDLARDGGPLSGFRKWLVVRANGGNCLTWEGLINLLLRPDSRLTGPPAVDEETSDLQGLAGLFEELFRVRAESDITRVHHDGARWLHRERWSTGPPRKNLGDSV